MIQDILPKIFHNEYCPEEPRPEDIVFVFRGREILAGKDPDEGIFFPSVSQIGNHLQFLFRIDDKQYHLFTGSLQGESGGDLSFLQEDFDFLPMFNIRMLQPAYLCFAAMTAWHLYVWYRDNRFCGRCGRPVVHDAAERVLLCPACGNRIYPKICPAIIVGVTDGNRILLTRYADREHKGNALISGFCEIGETVEETVRREVMEEAGLRVKNIRYYKSQPWGDAQDLLMGFYCEVDGSRTIHRDEKELAMARWVDWSELGEEPARISLTAEMIMHFKKQRSESAAEFAKKSVAETAEESMEESLAESGDLPAYLRSLKTGSSLSSGSAQPHSSGSARSLSVGSPRLGSAVLIPLIRKEDGYHILFEQRAGNLATQPGEICFPGGRSEAGESPEQTALREIAEELLTESNLEILAAFDPLIGPDGSFVWPFAAELRDYAMTFSKEEVSRVFTIPLTWFIDHKPGRYPAELVTLPGKDFPYELIPGGRHYPFRRKKHEILFYKTPQAVIWGLTARITDEFIRQVEGFYL